MSDRARVLRFVVTGALLGAPLGGCGLTDPEPAVNEVAPEPTSNEVAPEPPTVNEPPGGPVVPEEPRANEPAQDEAP